MKKLYDAVATIGKYKDRQTGEEKKRYITVGSVFEDDNGRLALKLDALPTTQEWSGWIAFYEPKQYDNQPRQSSPPRQDAHNKAKANAYQPQDDPDDEIPF